MKTNASPGIPPAIKNALRIVEHYDLCQITHSGPGENGSWIFETVFKVEMPSRYRRCGVTPLGIRREEPVTLVFRADYPIAPPSIRLRADLDPNLPHVFPRAVGAPYTSPCVYEGDLGDLLTASGDLNVVLSQITDWLARAARNGLCDATSGWEPIIARDTEGLIFFDTDKLLKHITEGWGKYECTLRYFRKDGFLGRADSDERVSTPPFDHATNSKGCKSVMLIVWPDETQKSDRRDLSRVVSLADIFKIYSEWKIKGHVRSAVRTLFKSASKELLKQGFYHLDIVVTVVFRRPYRLTDEAHNFEFIPFCVSFDLKAVTADTIDKCPAALLEQLYEVSPSLNARMSGVEVSDNSNPVLLIGCGSLGSKIAVNLVKAGRGPFVLVDKAPLLPHNLARHAAPGNSDRFLLGDKVDAVKEIIEAHGVEAKTFKRDIISVLRNPAGLEVVEVGKSQAVIDSTNASPQVLEALCTTE